MCTGAHPPGIYWSGWKELLQCIKKGQGNPIQQTGNPTQTIEHDSAGLNLYRRPYYNTENNNEDIVVSDCRNAIKVTTFGGIHRFSYTGHPSGTSLESQGLCTNPMSHILVCEDK